MSAARLLKPCRRRYTAAAALACSGLLSISSGRQLTRLDSNSTAPRPWLDQSFTRSYAHTLKDRPLKPHPAEVDPKKGDAATIQETEELDSYAPGFEDDDENAWASFSRDIDGVKQDISNIQWSNLGERITDFVLPAWARQLPGFVQKLQFELSMEPGSLADEIWQEAHDPDINPEIMWNATVRVGETLGDDELRFKRKRKEHMLPAFAKYLGLDEKDINLEDIPTIAMCGSGGGIRALVAGTSSYLSAQEAGLFDCVTYTAGVSGSCWLQTLYFSSVGKQNHAHLLNHIKSRLDTHIAFPPPALKLVTSAPTNKFILSGFIEKLKGDPGATFGLVDIYSLLLAARFMVPRGDLDVHDSDLKLSNQRQHLESGQHPMPIYTVVRHEIPVEEETKKESPHTPAEQARVKEKARREAWFQWFELTPWEVWCEEFGAGIPTWSLGRPFENGSNKLLDTGIALPETRQSLLLGIYGSAFCATLSHYYKEVRPLLAGMAGFKDLDGLLQDKDDDLVKIHMVEPATIPNFVWGMKDKLPATCPDSVFKTDHLQVMDAGMSNNLPIYPLLRPGRDVDILVAFDASADIQQENWLSVVDGYALQRGLKSWPVGAGWPKDTVKPQENAQVLDQAQVATPQAAVTKIAEARESRRQEKTHADDMSEKAGRSTHKTGESPTTGEHTPNAASDLGYCNIWVGTTQERTSTEEPPPSKRLSWDDPDDSTFHLSSPEAGMAVIYFPLLPNPDVSGVDPDKSDYLSTWNFIYTPEQVDKVVELARHNFQTGAEATKRTVRAVYERKKMLRLKNEDRKEIRWWKRRLREDGDGFAG